MNNISQRIMVIEKEESGFFKVQTGVVDVLVVCYNQSYIRW